MGSNGMNRRSGQRSRKSRKEEMIPGVEANLNKLVWGRLGGVTRLTDAVFCRLFTDT